MKDIVQEMERTVANLRDRTASGLAASADDSYDAGVTQRAVERLAERLDRTRDELSADIDDASARMLARLEDVRDDLDSGTGLFTRLFWMTVGAGIGYAVLNNLSDDPESKARRQRLQADAKERAETLKAKVQERAQEFSASKGEQAKHDAQVRAGRATGAVNRLLGRDEPEDAVALRQKIKSEVIGRVDGAGSLIVDVEQGGFVDLTGEVQDRSTVDEVTERIRSMSGVTRVTESVSVHQSS